MLIQAARSERKYFNLAPLVHKQRKQLRMTYKTMSHSGARGECVRARQTGHTARARTITLAPNTDHWLAPVQPPLRPAGSGAGATATPPVGALMRH